MDSERRRHEPDQHRSRELDASGDDVFGRNAPPLHQRHAGGLELRVRPPSTSGALRIGGNAVWTFETFDGLIDDVRIYDRALSLTEIQADRDTPVAAPPPNNQDPTVSLTSPANGASLQAPASISYSADAADADGTVAKVEFFRGSTLVGTDTNAPYTASESGVGAGNYTLKARATDNSGAAVDSSTRSITVTAPNNQDPTVSLTSPANGASLQAPASISYSADAADADGTVAKVEFFRGSTLVGTDTNAPYTASESGVGAGNYTLKARATDNSGAAVDSSTRSITVTAPNNQDPTVSLTSPANGASLQAPASISYSADAADADGTVAKVEFFRGSTLVGTDTNAPYTASESRRRAGNYTLKARATDNSGAAVDSSTRSITVTAPNNQDPTVSLTSPANRASLQAPASISYSADAADADGTVAKVESSRGSTLVGTDTNAALHGI